MTTCQNCGTKNIPDAKFCINCGNTLHKTSEKEVKSAKTTKLSKNKLTMIIGVTVVVAIVVVALLYLYRSPSNVIILNNNSKGGPGQSYLSQVELQTIYGPGLYRASGNANATKFGDYISRNSTGTTLPFLQNNVTEYWAVDYNITSAKSVNASGTIVKPFVFEKIFQSPVAKFVYDKMLVNTTFNVTNATLNGMTYSYLTVPRFNDTTVFVARKGNEAVIITIFGVNPSITALAAAVNGDIP